MKQIIVSIIAAVAATFWAVEARACECGCSSPAVCTNGVTNRVAKQFVIKWTPISEIPPRSNVVVASATPSITTNFIRETIAIQPVVIREVVVAPQPVYVERQYHTPSRVGIVNLPFVASAGVSISSYPSYYHTGTYWVNDSAYGERARIHANQAGYRNAFGGHRSYGQNYNNNPYGSVPSVGEMFNHGGRRR
ncbi:MAG: hypothetical protein KBC33_01745 [Candidatus Pacebacteria bacterium]|nr:hypothetical protein [Candidatus Paceibacterota bacterium]